MLLNQNFTNPKFTWVTTLFKRLRRFKFLHPVRWSISTSSFIWLFISMRFSRWGADSLIFWILETLLLFKIRVFNLCKCCYILKIRSLLPLQCGKSHKLCNFIITKINRIELVLFSFKQKLEKQNFTNVAPMFSIIEILYPIFWF